MTEQKPIHDTFVCQPGYDGVCAGAARALYRCRADMSTTMISARGTSLLAMTFNSLWAAALNLKLEGHKFKYFAMIHSDIIAQDMWLDVLIEELESKNLDVVGAVVPIKSLDGLTSIAVDNYPETFNPKCRLTMHEVYRLPETFTADDVGFPILLNTGCWVCRFDADWVQEMFFTINDRTRFDEAENTFKVEVEPEDWNFSRRCNSMGLKIAATRKVKLGHEGRHIFWNTYPWGSQEFDKNLIGESLVPVRMEGWQFPHDVEGWLLEDEGKALAELSRDRNVLEIGSYCGLSTICMAQTASHVTAVDTWDGRGTPTPRETLPIFQRNIERHGVAGKVDALTEVPAGRTYDVAFIDGGHEEPDVITDIQRAMSVLSEDGLLVFHDYRTFPGEHDGRWDAGVTRAVDRLIADGAQLIERHKTIAVVRPQKQQAV